MSIRAKPAATASHPSRRSITCSGTFAFADADIVLRSDDAVDFRVHRANLSSHSDVFKDMFETVGGDQGAPVLLTESSDLLDLLLRFMYGNLTPDVSTWSLQKLLDVAAGQRSTTCELLCKLRDTGSRMSTLL